MGARELGAKARLLQEMGDLYYLLGGLGRHWEDVAPGEQDMQRHLLLRLPSRLTASRLAAFMRAWKQWEAWCVGRTQIS